MTPLETIRKQYATATQATITDTFGGGAGWSTDSHGSLDIALDETSLRQLKREGVTHVHLIVPVTDCAHPSGEARPDYSVAELLAGIDPLPRREGEARDAHISRLLRLWKKQRAAHPYAKATKATWSAIIAAATDESDVERIELGGKLLRARGTYVAWHESCMGPHEYWVLARVKRHRLSRGSASRNRWNEVYQKYRKAGGWTKGR